MKLQMKHLCSIAFLFILFGMMALFFLLPSTSYSEHEKRYLEQKPSIQMDEFLSGDLSLDLENYISDQFPLRNIFVGIHARLEQFSGRNGLSGIYKGKDNYLITVPERIQLTQVRTNLQRFEDFASENQLPATMILVPTTGYIMQDKLPANTQAYHDPEIFAILNRECSAIDFIDIRALFEEFKNTVQLYYKTDHHLTSAGSYLLYQAYCNHMGIPSEIFEKTEEYTGFYGTTYTRSGLWDIPSDTLEIFTAKKKSTLKVLIENGSSSEEYDDLYFRDQLSNLDKYPVFLNGNHPVVKIKNQTCQNGRRLLLIKDSFAHCFATFLIENYEEICMVDLRYFRGNIKELIQSEQLNQLLYLYGIDNFSTSTDTLWLMS